MKVAMNKASATIELENQADINAFAKMVGQYMDTSHEDSQEYESDRIAEELIAHFG